MDPVTLSRIVEHFGRARQRPGQVVPKPPPELTPPDQPAAYRAMEALHAWFIAHGLGATAGYKIGCTTAVQQAYVGIDRPLGGGILARLVHRHAATLRFADYHKLGIETEIAVRLGTNVPVSSAPYTRASIAPFVREVMAAAEIVDERYADYRSWQAEALIADDFFNAGCVLGDPVPAAALDMATVRGTTIVDGVAFGTGLGGDVMGHPYAALAMLANVLAEADVMLREGEIVLTVSIVRTHWPAGPGTDYVCRFDRRLGELHIHVA
ncbi:MAG: hypothetical protein FJX56_07015 [Alphaproteobacteria bacterium]|nr:hypothetical protein [Alphaproteobacteria bacterium]